MSYKIASFNILKFSRQSVFQSMEKESIKDLDTIAEIIRENDFDIIAIQEILHKEALKELLEKISGQYADVLKRGSKDLGSFNIGARTNDSWGYRTKHWEGRWAKPRSYYSDRIAEGYGYIWNRDRIRLVTDMQGNPFEPRIFDGNGSAGVVRPPFVGRFTPINSRYEFRLINTHIVYGGLKDGVLQKTTEDDETQDDGEDTKLPVVEARRGEFQTLIEKVFTTYSTKVYDETGHDRNARYLVPYTFMLGDYNLNLSSAKGVSSIKAVLGKDMEEIVPQRNRNMKIVTVNDALTTLKGKPRDTEKQQLLKLDPVMEHHMANNYDHFSYDANLFEKHQVAPPETGAVLAFEKYQDRGDESKFDIYRQRISDHIPIYIEIDIRKRNKLV